MRWTFPTSYGRPTNEPPDWADRDALAEAVRLLDPDDAAELSANMWRLWMLPPRDPAGGRAFVSLDGGTPHNRALALYGDGVFALWLGELEDARAANEEALDLADDFESLALANLGMSRVAFEDGDYERSLAHAEASRAYALTLGEAMGQAPRHLHAQSLRMQGDYDTAAELFRESLELNRRLGETGMVDVEQYNLGFVELHRGNLQEAERYFTELEADELVEAALAFIRGDLDAARSLVERDTRELPSEDAAEREWLRQQLA